MTRPTTWQRNWPGPPASGFSHRTPQLFKSIWHAGHTAGNLTYIPKSLTAFMPTLITAFPTTPRFQHIGWAEKFIPNCPKSFEASIGARYLDFNTSTVTIYTGSVGWYVKNYWISLRPYITPGPPGTSVSSVITVRRYFQDGDNYLGVSAGLGFSRMIDVFKVQTDSAPTASMCFSHNASASTGKKLSRVIMNSSSTSAWFTRELTFDQGNYVWISSSLVGIRKRF